MSDHSTTATPRYKTIPGYSKYKISDTGVIISLWKPNKFRVLKQPLSKRGKYPIVCIVGDDGEQRCLKVHRLVLETFVGPCPEGMESLHRDGDRLNNNISNLHWGTHAENMADSSRHGTSTWGERGHHAKLNNKKALEIRHLHAMGNWSYTKLAQKFDVSLQTVSCIVNRRYYSHI